MFGGGGSTLLSSLVILVNKFDTHTRPTHRHCRAEHSLAATVALDARPCQCCSHSPPPPPPPASHTTTTTTTTPPPYRLWQTREVLHQCLINPQLNVRQLLEDTDSYLEPQVCRESEIVD
jgi:hypothetical protein